MQYRATNEQKAVETKFLTDGYEQHKTLTHLALEAHQAITPLGTVNEDGEKIQHGANMTMLGVRDVYFTAAQAFARFNEDYFPFMVLKCLRNGLIHDWIKDVIDANNGVIPETQEEVLALGGIQYQRTRA